MKRMLIATVMVIVTITVFILSYTVVVIPLEYTVDTLQDTYTTLSDDMGWDDSDDINDTIGMIPYFLAGSVVFGVVLTFIWYFAYAHKKEFERF